MTGLSREQARLVELLSAARRVLVFTGAGISTGSGIPDFRGPRGVWRRRQPVYFDAFLASEEARVEYWDGKQEVHEAFRDATPNAAHASLVALERSGRLGALVTQNIDGLHRAAGSDPARIIELHGTNRLVECLGCGARREPDDAVAAFRRQRRTPTCPDCGGWLKFATVSFGQALDPDVLAAAGRAAEAADLALTVGSSLSVHPAATIPLIAARRGAPHVIVNQGPTEQDALATLRLDGDACAILPPCMELLPPVPPP